MKKIFTFIFLFFCIYNLSAQTYSTGKRSLTFIDNSRTDRPIPTDIYYPANTAGNNVAIATGSAKFPVVVFGHGFLIPASSYKWLADSLVKTGYIVALPTTEDGLIPSHLDFGLDLNFLCSRVTSLNDSASSFLYQRVTKRAAVAGHSMGGGASFLAAALQNSVIKAVFNFAAAETTPPASTAAFLDFKPTLMFSGSSDCVAEDSIQNAMYNNIFLACKTYVDITDALHCQFANNNLICQAGQIIAGCGFTGLSTQTVLAKTTSLVSPFLDYYLKDNCQRGDIFVNTYNNITGVTKRRSCFPFPNCGIVPVKLISFTGKVDNNKSTLYWTTASEENFDHFEIERSTDGLSFNSLMNVSPKTANSNGASYSAVDPYPFAGINFYRLKMVDRDGSFAYSNIVKLETGKKQLAITQLYPNPVKDVLNVQLQAGKKQTVTAIVFDITGKQLQVNAVSLNEGFNNTTVILDKLAAGTYILQYKNEEGSSLGTFRVVKN
ncbi:MAG: T9SS type A sorting domain-containing protein [Ferruginibacter sp.]